MASDSNALNTLNTKLSYSQENLDRTRKFLSEPAQEKLINRSVKYF